MKLVARTVIVAVLVGCAAGGVWAFSGDAVSDRVVGKANVVGGLAALAALGVAVAALWSQAARQRGMGAEPGRLLDAMEYLAVETLREWRIQAKDRRITTPSPAAVRWSWAGEDVTVPASELRRTSGSVGGGLVDEPVPTAGVVTRLREQLYDRMGGEQTRVVILGAPGAGKTAAMLLLLIDILEHRPAGSVQPVPVWLTLSGWDPDTVTLRDWVAATLTRDYPGLAAGRYGGPGVAAELIRTERIALFLDGLDEMPAAAQGRALQMIERDAAGLQVVLTCRRDQYRAAVRDGRLYGAAVITLLPVDLDQVEEFLLAEQLGQRRRWLQFIERLRAHPHSVAARTLTSPLALSLARDAYARSDPAGLLDGYAYRTSQDLMQHLLARFLTLAYPAPAEHRHATRWLRWIAQQMGTSRDLCWWDIPGWVSRWHFRFLFALTSGMTAGLAVGFAFEFVFTPWHLHIRPLWFVIGFGIGFAFAFLAGLIGGPVRKPRNFVVRWPTRENSDAYYAIVSTISIVPIYGALLLVAAITNWEVFDPEYTLPSLFLYAFISMLMLTLAAVCIWIWSTPLATARAASPGQVHRSDRRHTLAFTLTLTVGFALTLMLLTPVPGNFLITSTFAVAVLLTRRLGPALQLTLTEMMWALRGRPVRFMPLLQTALDRQVLCQAGAVYQFRHAALQDLLAAAADRPD